MNGRERVRAAIRYQKPDRVPVEFCYTDTPAYEYGAEKVNEIYSMFPSDFGTFSPIHKPVIPASDFNEAGEYHAFRRDEWGTLWEHRIYGIAGIEAEYPLDDLDKLDSYQFPALPKWATDDAAHVKFTQAVRAHQKEHYYMGSIGGFFEKLIALRPFEDVLCDLITGEEKIIQLLDRLTDYYEALVKAHIRAGADAIAFGDDYGTQSNLIFSKDLFREYFYPRYKRLIAPARAAGLDVRFHSCGKIDALFDDFREMGVNAIWPQLPLYNMEELAYTLKDLGIALMIHTDRANTMTRGTPEQVKELVYHEFEVFRPDLGGSWFYIEADNGFPYENLKTLVETIGNIRCK